jgi:CubicO group peptidase (beta-lactamase class C family)
MRRHYCFFCTGWLITLAVLTVLDSPWSFAQHAVSSTDTRARVARIENGLLPSVVVEGHTSPKMKLADRMKYYHVPGVSIAFIDRGRIAWTRAYGVADTQTGQPVTAETLFPTRGRWSKLARRRD